MDSLTGLSLPSGDPSASDSARAPEPPRFRFPLPFDPLRLAAGVLTRWQWLVAGVLVFAVIGTILGVHLTRPTYAVSVSLIKRRSPQTVQASQTGNSFHPSDLNDATLLATLLAGDPLDRALRRVGNNIDPAAVRSMVEAVQLEGADIFFITYHSPISPQDAFDFSTVWAEEINIYTQKLQQAEAREVRVILQKEVADLEKKIAETNRQILEFSKEKDYLGGDSQVSAALSKLSQIELQLEAARTSVASKEVELKNLIEQIRHQSPIESQLKTAKEELANLRATYTDVNPLVQTKLQSIEYIESQVALLGANRDAGFESYTGTPLGNEIYLSIIGLRNELQEAKSQIGSLEKLQQQTAERLAEFPGIVSGYDALQKKRSAITEGYTLMSNRLREAEIFASGAPGYWQVFQAPDLRHITPSSLVKKPAILGIGAAVMGAGFSILLAFFLTKRSTRRSVIECCIAVKAPFIAQINRTSREDIDATVDHFWLTHLAPRLGSARSVLFCTPALDADDERSFWQALERAVRKDTGKSVRVQDLTPDGLWSGCPAEETPDWLEWMPMASGHDVRGSHPVTFMRASSLPVGEARDLLASIDCWIAPVTGEKDWLGKAAHFASLAESYLPPCQGTIVWSSPAVGLIRQVADTASCYLAQRLS